MPGVTLDKITKSFGTEAALRNVSLDIADGEFCVIVGPSGCGKSTLLRIVAGLEHPDQGTLQIGGRTVNDLGPAERRIAMVFQSYALYPHMNVYRNMSFGLKFSGVTREDADRRVREVARMLQLEHLLERRPAELSGGERQRTAIGRAIVRQPDVFLFDEPLSNLDASLRVNTRLEIAKLHRTLGTTMIYVTHDQVEAMTLADRMVVMNEGRVEQSGTPLELYDTPANLFVAGFIGAPKMNFVSGDAAKNFDAETIGIRPEHIALSSGTSDWTATVALIENLGSETIVYVDAEGIGPVTVRAPSGAEVRPGDRIGLALDRTRLHRFDEHGNRITA